MTNFNFWFVAAPVLMAIMAVIGATMYSFNPRTLKIRKCWDDKSFNFVLNLLSVICTIIFCGLMFKESALGILDVLINSMGGDDDPIWALIIAPTVFAGIILCSFMLFYASGKIGQWAKHGYFLELQEKLKKEPKLKFITTDTL